jgi:hypothetical protein
MGVACWAVIRVSPSRSINVLAGVPVGAAVFYGIASALHIPELADLRDALLRKLR